MLNVPYFNVSSEEHRARTQAHLISGEYLKQSIESLRLSELAKLNVQMQLPDAICMAANPKWADRKFGAVNTISHSGCICFAAKIILDLPAFQKFYGHVSMEEIFSEVETKGYRMWKLEKIPKALNISNPTVESLKEIFHDNEDICACNTLEEIYSVAGHPVGIGGSAFFLDYLIAQPFEHAETGDSFHMPVLIGSQTRTLSIDQIVTNIASGYPVPIRVNNSIYWDDPFMRDGHYVVLFGFENDEAIVVDSSFNYCAGVRKIPIIQLFRAILADDNLIGAWNCNLG